MSIGHLFNINNSIISVFASVFISFYWLLFHDSPDKIYQRNAIDPKAVKTMKYLMIFNCDYLDFIEVYCINH